MSSDSTRPVPPLGRWFSHPAAAPVAFVGGVLIGLGVLQLRLGLPAEAPVASADRPPLDADGAHAWLAAKAGTPMDPVHPAWESMARSPGVVGVWRDELLARERSPEEAWALAVYGQDPAWLAITGHQAGLDFTTTAVLALPAAADIVAQACPGLRPPLDLLCTPARRSEAQSRLDTVLAIELGSADPVVAAHALEAGCNLGTARGATVGRAAMEGKGGVEDRAMQRLRGQLLRACALDEATAITELVAALEADPDLALVAATELARLGAARQAPSLDALAARLGDTGDAVLVRYAAAVARGQGQDFAAEVSGPGL